MKKFSRTGLAIAVFLGTTCLVSPAAAQTYQPPGAPPVRQTIDENGVDLSGGSMIAGIHTVSIGGEGAKGVSWSRTITDGYSHWDSAAIFLTVSGSKYTVSAGSHSESFTLSGGNYISDQKTGSTLTPSGTTYTYTTSDGTVYALVPWSSVDQKQYGGTYRVSTITYPTGEISTFNWEVVNGICKWNEKYMFCIRLTGERLRSIQSTNGYEVIFAFVDENPSQEEDPTGSWAHIATVTARNRSVDPASQSWPTLTLNWPASIPLSGTASVTDSLGRTTNYTFNTSGGYLNAIQHPGASSNDVTVGHNASYMVSGVTKNGSSTTYSYSDLNNVRTTTVSDSIPGDRIVKTDLATGLVSSDTNEAGKTTSYTYYSGSGLLWTVTAPEGNKATFEYDSRGNQTKMTLNPKPGSPLSPIITQASYPASDPVKTWQCASGTSATQCNKPLTSTDANGKVTNYQWDSATGMPSVVTLPPPSPGAVQPQTRYTYSSYYAQYRDANGNLVNFATPVTRLTATSQCRTQASCTGSADEQKSTIIYGTANVLPVSISKGAGDGTLTETTGLSYDTIGNLVSVDGPLSGTADTTVVYYDALRRKTGVIGPDPDGVGPAKFRATQYSYNTRGDIWLTAFGTTNDQSATAFNSFVESYHMFKAFDSYGRLERQNVWSNGVDYSVNDYVYDSASRPICTIAYMDPAQWGPQATTCAPLQTNGPNGPDRVTQYTYDAVGRVIQVTTGVGTSDAANDQTTTYSDNGKIATLLDGENNLTTYEYDGFDRLVKARFPVPTKGANSSSTTDYEQYTLDPAGNATSVRLRDGTSIAYTYDNLNRVTSKDLPGTEPTVTYAYDLFGDPTSIAGGTTLTNTYDALGRRTFEGQPFGSMSYQYDAANRRTQITWHDGFYVNYDYLVTGEVSKIRENGAVSGVGVLATYGYDNLGNMTSLTRGNGTVTSYAFDPVSRLASLTQDLSGTTYDVTTTFAYNPASQITSQTRSNDQYHWQGQVNVTRLYTPNGLNQYTAAGPASFTYDARGNLTGDGTNTYSYTSENLLSARSGGITLSYDPIGRMIDYDTTVALRFMYDGNYISAEIDNPTGAILRRYVYGPGADAPIVWYEGSGTTDRRFLHADERGSIVAVTNSSGVLLSGGILTYDEYGIPSVVNMGRFQYTGQAWFPELGLSYYKSRMYSPTLGRFMQTDPIGYGDGINWYNYVRGDPVNFFDPMGLNAITGWGNCVPSAEGNCYPATIGGNEITVTGPRLSCDVSCQATDNSIVDVFLFGSQRGGVARAGQGLGAAGLKGLQSDHCPAGPGLKIDVGVGATGFLGVLGASLGISGEINIPTDANGRPSLRGSQLSISGSVTGLAGLGLFAGAGPNLGMSGTDGPSKIVSGSSDTVMQVGAGEGAGVEIVRPINNKPADYSGSGGRLAVGAYGAVGKRFTGTLSTPQLGC